MQQVVTSVRSVSHIIAEITVATSEQRDGITQVNQALGQMDGVTQQNAALVEQAAAAAESLQDQAGTLARAVGVFKLGGADAAGQSQSTMALQTRAPRPATRLKPHESLASRNGKPRARDAAKTADPAGGASDEWEEF
jgi:methyl-accepting chemotaxis protein